VHFGSGIGLTEMPEAAMPLAFFFSQSVTNVAARKQSNADTRAVFEVLTFWSLSPSSPKYWQ
jgi:hypothetical protein